MTWWVLLLLLLLPTRAVGAITITSLTANGDTTCTLASQPVTGAYTPSAGAVVFLLVTTEVASGTAGTVTAVQNGVNYTEVTNALSTNSVLRATLLRASNASLSGTVAITVSADQNNCT